MHILRLNLQRFSELSPTAGAPETAAEPVETGVTETAAASQENKRPSAAHRRSNPLANVRYGVQDVQEAAPQDGAGEDEEASWKAAKERHRDRYNNEMQTAVQNRIKNIKASEENLKKLDPIIKGMYEKYGVQEGDIDSLVNAYNNDDDRLASEALERGVSVDQLKEIKSLERDRAELERIRNRDREEEAFNQHIAKLQQQAEELKKSVPGFDLIAELRGNQKFAQLTSPQYGLSVEDAYYLVHRAEIDAGARMASRRIAMSQAANASRPTENGLLDQAAVEIKADPSKWSKKDREEVRRRVQRGDKIVL